MRIESYERAREVLKAKYEAMKKHLEFRKKLWEDYELMAIEFDADGEAIVYAIDGATVYVEVDGVHVGTEYVQNVTEMKAAIKAQEEERKKQAIKYGGKLSTPKIFSGLRWRLQEVDADADHAKAALYMNDHLIEVVPFTATDLAPESALRMASQENRMLDELPKWFAYMSPSDAKSLINFFNARGCQNDAEKKHKDNVLRAMIKLLEQHGEKYTPFSVGMRLSTTLRGHPLRTMAIRYKMDYTNTPLEFTLVKDTGGNRWDVRLDDGKEIRLQMGFDEDTPGSWWVASAIRKDHKEYDAKHGAIDAWYKDNVDATMDELLNAIPEGVAITKKFR